VTESESLIVRPKVASTDKASVTTIVSVAERSLDVTEELPILGAAEVHTPDLRRNAVEVDHSIVLFVVERMPVRAATWTRTLNAQGLHDERFGEPDRQQPVQIQSRCSFLPPLGVAVRGRHASPVYEQSIPGTIDSQLVPFVKQHGREW